MHAGEPTLAVTQGGPKILVIGTPRSGSHWPVNYLRDRWRCRWLGKEQGGDDIPWRGLPSTMIVHSHDFYDLPEHTDQWHLVLTHREDVFEQICSGLWAQHTEEWTRYDRSQQREPLEVSLFHIIRIYQNWCVTKDLLAEATTLWQRPWQSRTLVSYEQMRRDISCLDHLAPQDKPDYLTRNLVSESSGHDYRQLIKDYDELRQQFYNCGLSIPDVTQLTELAIS